MNALLRRGACPTLSAPMPTGDGLLARLNPVAAGLSPAQLVGLCEAASRHGNGIVEVTVRGSFQIRGLSAASAGQLAAEVDALGIVVRSGVPVETGPLAGLDPDEIADPRPLAGAIRADIAKAGLEARLGPKVSVIVDGGGAWLDEVKADARLTALGGGAWQLAVGGDAASAATVGTCTEADALAAVIAVLGEIAKLGRHGRASSLATDVLMAAVSAAKLASFTPPSVLPDISPTRGEIGRPHSFRHPATLAIGEATDEGSISPLVGKMSGRTEGGDVERDLAAPRRQRHGTIRLTDGRFAIPVALPFGHSRAETLIDVVRAAELRGVSEFRLAPNRTLLFLAPSQAAAYRTCDTAHGLGFVVDAADPRARIAACPGAPACASGRISARALAAEIATAMPATAALDLHVSGCEKRCAKPGHDGLTLLGRPEGVALALGKADAAPLATVAHGEELAAIRRVMRLVAAERHADENDAACLARIGLARLAKTFADSRTSKDPR